MKQLSKKVFFLLFPYGLIFASVIIIDPYEYFSFNLVAQSEQKKKVASRINYVLWKLLHFKKAPHPNVIIGDSRMNVIKTDRLNRIDGKAYYNLSYGGGTLSEICNTFWWVKDLVKLKRVYLGISFNHYNKNNLRNRVSGAVEILEKSHLYVINRDVIRSSYRLLSMMLADKAENIENPNMSENAFWEHQLNSITSRYYSSYIYPSGMYNQLKEISTYCKNNGIELAIVNMPTHVSLQEKIETYGLEKEYQRFLSDMRQLGTVYDFDYRNQLTENRANFSDPYHIRKDLFNIVHNEIWGNNSKGYAKIYRNGYPIKSHHDR